MERGSGAEADRGRPLARREPSRRKGWGKHNVWEALEDALGHRRQGISKPGVGTSERPGCRWYSRLAAAWTPTGTRAGPGGWHQGIREGSAGGKEPLKKGVS